MSRIIKKGAVDQTIYIEVLDSTSTSGGRKTGLAYNTASLTAYYVRNAGSATQITLATLAAANSAHSDGGFKEIDSTNMPGVYRLDLPDAAVASGADSVVVTVRGATGMAQVSAEIQLVAVDLQDSVRGGMTALPNAAADAAGGLPISDAGGLDLDAKIGALTFTVAGKVDANATHAAGTAWGSGAITAASIAAAAITSAKFAAGAVDAAALAADAVAEIADAIWDEATAGHTTAGTTGKALTDAGSAGDPWSTAVPGAYGAGTAGFILGTNLDATVSSRAASATALSTATWTNARAGYLDTLNTGVTVATNNDKTGYTASTVSDKTGYTLSATGSAAMTEGYAALGAAATLPQLLYEVRALLAEKAISSTTLTTKKLDGSTTAATYTLDDATTPTSITRAT